MVPLYRFNARAEPPEEAVEATQAREKRVARDRLFAIGFGDARFEFSTLLRREVKVFVAIPPDDPNIHSVGERGIVMDDLA